MEQKFQGLLPAPQWIVWGLLAGWLFTDPAVAGIMFDHFHKEAGQGLNIQRQGFAVFKKHAYFRDLTNIQNPGEQAIAQLRYLHAWVHEMGHAFNLVHPSGTRSEVKSWMNYFNSGSFANRERDFWDGFQRSFDGVELRQLRHYPLSRVIMGGDDFAGDVHLKSRFFPRNPPGIELRLRSKGRFLLLEPVQVELRLRNLNEEPVPVNTQLDPAFGHVEFFIRSENGEKWEPLPAPACLLAEPVIRELSPARTAAEGADRYSRLVPLFYQPGRPSGLIFEKPGAYQLRAQYCWNGYCIISNVHRINVSDLPYECKPDDKAISTQALALNLFVGGSRLGDVQTQTLGQIQLWEKKLLKAGYGSLGAILAAAIAQAEGQTHIVRKKDRLGVLKGDPEKALVITEPYMRYYQSKKNKQRFNNLPYRTLTDRRREYFMEAGKDKEEFLAQMQKEQNQLARDLGERGVKQAVLDDLNSRLA